MTRERVRAQQATEPDKPARLLVVTVATTAPLTVTLPSGAILPGVEVDGCIYTVGGRAFLFIQEPAIGPVLPIA